jgi:outer membrane protein assembly factor BamB
VIEGRLYASIESGKMAALDPNAETGADCENETDDDDDGGVNEGCERAGQRSESGGDCRNAENDDGQGGNPDDSVVNDGCPPFYTIWTFPSEDDEDRLDLEGIYSAPIVEDGFVYFGAYDGKVYALDAETGIPIWSFETDDPIVASMTLNDGILYAGSTDGRLYAIETSVCLQICPRSAATIFDTGSSIWAAPLLVGDVIYVADMDGNLHARQAADVTKPVDGFTFKTDAGLTMDPTAAGDDTILLGGIDKKLFAIDAETGQQRWGQPFDGGNWFWGRPLVDEETIYVADLDGNVHAVGLEDGRPKWASPFRTERAVRAGPVLADETLVVVDRGGNTYGINPEDGGSEWGPTALGKTVFADPFLLQAGSQAPTATGGTATAAGTQTPNSDGDGAIELVILAKGGDICRIDPVDGSPTGSKLCEEVPL